MFESASYNKEPYASNNDKNQAKVYEYNGSMNRLMYYQQDRTAPNTMRNYELDYSNPLIFPSKSSYRNLLENKYQIAEITALDNNHSTINTSMNEKEKLIEEIKRQMKKEEMLSKESLNEERSINDYNYAKKPSEQFKVYDKSTINCNSNNAQLIKNNSNHSLSNNNDKQRAVYSCNVNSNANSNEENNKKMIDLVKENESLKMDNSNLKIENEALKKELQEIKSKEQTTMSLIESKKNNIFNNNDNNKCETNKEDQNDQFKNYLILENERLTKALKEIQSIKDNTQNRIDNKLEQLDIAAVLKKKTKKKHKKKRAKSKTEKIINNQTENINSNNYNVISNKSIKRSNSKQYNSPNKFNEYNLDNSERVKTCFACLLGNNTFYKGYLPTNFSKEQYQSKTLSNKSTKSKSKSKTKNTIKTKPN